MQLKPCWFYLIPLAHLLHLQQYLTISFNISQYLTISHYILQYLTVHYILTNGHYKINKEINSELIEDIFHPISRLCRFGSLPLLRPPRPCGARPTLRPSLRLHEDVSAGPAIDRWSDAQPGVARLGTVQRCTSRNANVQVTYTIHKYNYTRLHKITQDYTSTYHSLSKVSFTVVVYNSHVLFENLFHKLVHRQSFHLNVFESDSKCSGMLDANECISFRSLSKEFKRGIFGCGQHWGSFSNKAELSPHCQHLSTGKAAFRCFQYINVL